MEWWGIVKSSRREAYQDFLDSLFAGGFQEEIPVDEGRKLGFMEDPWFFVANDELTGIEIYGMTDELNQHREFIMGMFEQEYPTEYQELKMRVLRLMAEKGPPVDDTIIDNPADLPPLNSYTREKRIWLQQHVLVNVSALGEKKFLLAALISHYDEMDYMGAYKLIKDIPATAFEGTDSLWTLFRKYDDIMDTYELEKPAVMTTDQLITTDDHFQIVRDLLLGDLNGNPFFENVLSHIIPFGVKKIERE